MFEDGESDLPVFGGSGVLSTPLSGLPIYSLIIGNVYQVLYSLGCSSSLTPSTGLKVGLMIETQQATNRACEFSKLPSH